MYLFITCHYMLITLKLFEDHYAHEIISLTRKSQGDKSTLFHIIMNV